MSCGRIWGKVQVKLSTGQSWAWETRVLFWKLFYRRIRPGGTIPLCIFHMIFISTIEVIRVLKSATMCSRQRSELCSPFTQWPHSAKAYLVSCSANYNQQCPYGLAHPFRAPFICSDTTPGHGSVKEGKKRLLYGVASRRRTDDTGGWMDEIEHVVVLNKIFGLWKCVGNQTWRIRNLNAYHEIIKYKLNRVSLMLCCTCYRKC